MRARLLGPVLVLVSLMGRGLGGCPAKCSCDSRSVECISQQLDAVPDLQRLDSSPIIIDLSGNHILEVLEGDFSFDTSDQLKEIYLNKTDLVDIHPYAFDELENLQELYLSDNFLYTVDKNLIAMNEFMLLLDLSGNHFLEMPKIISGSLEVLVMAKSRVSTIPLETLSELPKLKILLLQENNLKFAHPEIFTNTPNLDFVNLDLNPWQCNCKNVQFFRYLLQQKLWAPDGPVQCRTDDMMFLDIFDASGALTEIFKTQCNPGRILSSVISDDVDKDILDMQKYFTAASPEVQTTVVHVPPPRRNCPQDDFAASAKLYFLLALALTFIVGIAIGCIGSYLTGKRMGLMNVASSESTNKLLIGFKGESSP